MPAAKGKSKSSAVQTLARTQDTAARRIQRHSREHFLPRIKVKRRLAWQAEQEDTVDTSAVLEQQREKWQEQQRAMREPGYVANVAREASGGELVLPPRRRWRIGKSKFELLMEGEEDSAQWPNDIELVGEIVRKAEAKRIQLAREAQAERDAVYRERRAKRSNWRDLSKQTPSSPLPATPAQATPERKHGERITKANWNPPTPSVTSDETESNSADAPSGTPNATPTLPRPPAKAAAPTTPRSPASVVELEA